MIQYTKTTTHYFETKDQMLGFLKTEVAAGHMSKDALTGVETRDFAIEAHVDQSWPSFSIHSVADLPYLRQGE